MNDIVIEYTLENIRNNFFDAGNKIFKTNYILKIKNVVLVEVYTGSIYKYFAVNYKTKDKKYLFFTKKSLPLDKYEEVVKKILCYSHLFIISGEMGGDKSCEANVEPVGGSSAKRKDYLNVKFQKNTLWLSLIRYRFPFIDRQRALSYNILNSLKAFKIPFSKGESGIGKIKAYVLSSILYKLRYVLKITSDSLLALMTINACVNKDFVEVFLKHAKNSFIQELCLFYFQKSLYKVTGQRLSAYGGLWRWSVSATLSRGKNFPQSPYLLKTSDL